MENAIEQIKNKIDIIEFIGSFITLKKAGRNFKANCPFHSEKTPSFVISPERQIWHCFGSCGEGGDVIKFLMKWENITFFEALKELAEKTGVKLETQTYADSGWKKKERFLNMNVLATEYFTYILNKTSYGKKALDYLEARKINKKTVETFKLGYSPASWDSILQFLKRKKYTDEEMLENGLLVRSERGKYYDRFRGRLMFPIQDSRGQVIAFSGRSMDSSDTSAKYINTPETPIYHKRETLYGIQLAKDAIKKDKNVFIVEGEFDMITPFQNGFENFVAIKGSALTREQLMFLKRYTNSITLTLDADPAGEEAIKRGIEEAERMDFEIEVVSFDFAKDPDEAIIKDPTAFKKAIKHPIPIYDFLISISQKKYSGDDPFNKKKIGEEVLPYIERISNPIVKSHYIKKIAGILGVSESSIESILRRISFKKKQTSVSVFQKKEVDAETHTHIIEKFLLSSVFQAEIGSEETNEIAKLIKPEYFSTPSYTKLFTLFFEFQTKKPQEKDILVFAQSLSNELKAVFDELFLFASTEVDLKKNSFSQLCFRIKINFLKRQMKELLYEDKDSDEKKQKLTLLNEELKEVEKKLTTL
jgi:DNA primase